MTLCFVLGYLEFLHIVEGALYPARTRALYDRRLCQGCDLSASWPCPLGVLPVMSVSLWFQCFCRLHQLSWNAVNNKQVCPWRPARNWQGILKFFWKGSIDKFWFIRLPFERTHPWMVCCKLATSRQANRSRNWSAVSAWPTLSEKHWPTFQLF